MLLRALVWPLSRVAFVVRMLEAAALSPFSSKATG